MPNSCHAPCRVLICDDTLAIRTLLRAMLAAETDIVVVAEASNGNEAVAGAGQHRPDIVLLDVSMPVMDGIQAIPRILEAAPATSIIMLSGFSSPQIKERARAAGAVGYVEKGTDFGEIVAAIRLHCQNGSDT
jgi:DNA-binding NarL/FixJ family response regulator